MTGKVHVLLDNVTQCFPESLPQLIAQTGKLLLFITPSTPDSAFQARIDQFEIKDGNRLRNSGWAANEQEGPQRYEGMIMVGPLGPSACARVPWSFVVPPACAVAAFVRDKKKPRNGPRARGA